MADHRDTQEENRRLETVHALRLLDTPREERFDRITRLARRAFGVDVASISLVDADRVWFKSCVGMDVQEIPRSPSFCDLVVQGEGTLIVPDAMADPRYANLPAGARFYAGQGLHVRGRRVGALCLVNFAPRDFGPEDVGMLADLAEMVEVELDTLTIAEAWLAEEERSAAIRHERDFMAAVLETAGSLVMVCDHAGRIVRYNKACEQVSGFSFEEVRGKPYWNFLVAREQIAEVRDGYLARGPEDYPRTIEATWLARDGRRRQVRWTATALLDADGKLAYVVGTGTDITEWAALERLKDEFLGVVSHELRTPLTSIRGALGLLSGGLMGEVAPKGQRMLEIASLSAERLSRLVNDLLDVERLENGQLAIALQPCNAMTLMEQAVATVQCQAADAGVTLMVEGPATSLMADPDRVIQVLTNLLSNAVKFSPRGGCVGLRARSGHDGLVFEVQDEGPGIPPEKLDLVFDRFQQLDGSESREKGGTGLGLAICRGLVAQHGGRIWAENGAERGAIFRFVLPIAEPQRSEIA